MNNRRFNQESAGMAYEEFIDLKNQINMLRTSGIDDDNPDEIIDDYVDKLTKLLDYFKQCENSFVFYIYHKNTGIRIDDDVIKDIQECINNCLELEPASEKAYKTLQTEKEEFTPIDNEHGAIIVLMKALGCKGNTGGVCHGISNMGMQAILLGNKGITSYNKRMDFIIEIFNNALDEAENNPDIISKAKNAASEAVELEKNNAKKVGASFKPKHEKMIANEAYHIEILKSYLNSPSFLASLTTNNRSLEEVSNLYDSVKIFSQSVDLYFNPAAYAKDRQFEGLFEEFNKPKCQESDKVLPLLQPTELDHTGGISVITPSDARTEYPGQSTDNNPSKSGNHSGHIVRYFEDDELEQYLGLIMRKLSSELTQPVSLILSNDNHTITIGFNPDPNPGKSKFIFINSGYAEEIKNTHELVSKISGAFATEDDEPEMHSPIILELSAYVSTNQPEIKHMISDLLNWEMKIPYNAIKDMHPTSRDMISRHSLLDRAAYINDIETMETLLKMGADINSKDKKGNTALWFAIAGDNAKAVDLMLNKGARYNDINKNGDSVLHVTAGTGNSEILETLLNISHKHINTKGKRGFTPLHIAAMCGNTHIADKLLNEGAKIDLQDNDGNTPLHRAIMMNEPDIVEFLLDHSADLDIENNAKETPLMMILKDDELRSILQLKVIDSICESIEANDINDINEISEILDYFKNIGMTVNLNANPVKNPLRYAVEKNNINTVNLLLDNGADVNARSIIEGDTALMVAAKNSNIAIINLLIAKKADVEAVDDWNNKTALMMAKESGNEAAVHALNQAKKSNKTILHFETSLSIFSRGPKEQPTSKKPSNTAVESNITPHKK